MQRFLRSLPSLFLLAGLAQARAQAPEPAPMPPADATLPYAVEVVPSGDSRLDAALSAVSQLVSLREQAPTSVGGVLGRAEGDRERLQQALRSEGYWAGVARITIDGTPLGDPELLARLEAAPRGTPVPVRITVEPGQAYRVSSIAVRGTEPAEQPVVDAAVATPSASPPATSPGPSRCWRRSGSCSTGCWPRGIRWRCRPGGTPRWTTAPGPWRSPGGSRPARRRPSPRRWSRARSASTPTSCAARPGGSPASPTARRRSRRRGGR
ncbi:hypothetical protein ACFQY5_30815 [Paeniroseomonas aquatica]|uniref:hypothetical protein n=1 Tax=Paeniroseomonas aquatica TaxID=373043 RepID=UPI003607D246